MTFAESILASRLFLGLTLEEATELLGVSRRALERWEAGLVIPLDGTQERVLASYAEALVAKP